MWTDRGAVGIFIAFFIIFFQLPSASALDNKQSASKNLKKKSVAVRKAAPARKKASVRRAKLNATAAKRPVAKRAVRAKNKKSGSLKTSAKRKSKSSRPRTKKRITAARKKNVAYQRARAARVSLSAGELAGLNRTHDPLSLHSNVAYVVDQLTSEVLFEKNSDVPLPIASLTKLMTGLVVAEAGQDMQELLEVTTDDIDHIKNTSSRLPIGAKLTRADMLHIALMSSENRAASALGRNYPGGIGAFVRTMNAKAASLGMTDTYYVEPTGLSSENVASASDLAKLVEAASGHDLLRLYSTYDHHSVQFDGKELDYKNSNRLVGKPGWDIELQKTGYIREAGRCLLMQLNLDDRPVTMIFLDSKSAYSRSADAGQMLSWIQEKIGNDQTASAE
ncbi:MAG: hypothetical protein A3I66_02505 [Burkholderiales bacterium RIFCSPLOWO2_02_FULL_57_36]|nr:MAG: hypothetical protein A3I66_02505 [Burkholderiales bacterium RIFCSPLOWO2_02_FULL_57_36]